MVVHILFLGTMNIKENCGSSGSFWIDYMQFVPFSTIDKVEEVIPAGFEPLSRQGWHWKSHCTIEKSNW